METIARYAKPDQFPVFLEKALSRMGARYLPNHREALLNLDADDRKVLDYLGTYFPRTVVECQTIGRELLSLAAVVQAAERLDRPFRILDLGSGSGGGWIGFALALNAAMPGLCLEVIAVDGNARALAQQQELVRTLEGELDITIQLVPLQHVMRSDAEGFEQDLQDCVDAVLPDQAGFDLVLVSKHFSEHYHAAGAAANGVVQAGVERLAETLSETGFLVILDLTCRVQSVGQFFPYHLAAEIKQAVSGHDPAAQVVLPLPCASMSRKCAAQSGCFTQRRLELHRLGYRCDQTKFTYWVLARPEHAETLLAGTPIDQPWKVNEAKPQEACHLGKKIYSPGACSGFTFPIDEAACR